MSIVVLQQVARSYAPLSNAAPAGESSGAALAAAVARTRKEKAELLRGNGPDPDSLDPHRARSTEAMMVLRDLFECLTRLDRNAAPAPGAAESWTVSDDGREYRFKLRANGRWSNGDAVVADDFVAGLRRLVDPATASQYAQVVDVILNAPEIIAGKRPVESLGVAAPEVHTVVISLSSPAPYLPGLMAHPSCAPLHRASLAQFGERFARAGSQVSNGAFVLKEWLQGSYIRAERNSHYWNNAANRLDSVKYLQIGDENAELRAYRAGELHCTYVVPRGQFDWIKQNLAAELHLSPQLSIYYYGFNLDRKRFTPKIRRALSLVIDRERLANSVLARGRAARPGGGCRQAFTILKAQSSTTPRRPWPSASPRRNVCGRRKVFTAARPLSFDCATKNRRVHGKVAVAVGSMWKEALGVDVKLAAVGQIAVRRVEAPQVDV